MPGLLCTSFGLIQEDRLASANYGSDPRSIILRTRHEGLFGTHNLYLGDEKNDGSRRQGYTLKEEGWRALVIWQMRIEGRPATNITPEPVPQEITGSRKFRMTCSYRPHAKQSRLKSLSQIHTLLPFQIDPCSDLAGADTNEFPNARANATGTAFPICRAICWSRP